MQFDLPPGSPKVKPRPSSLAIAAGACCGIPFVGGCVLLLLLAALGGSTDRSTPQHEARPSVAVPTIPQTKQEAREESAEMKREARAATGTREARSRPREAEAAEAAANRPDLEVQGEKGISEGYVSYVTGTVRNNTDRTYAYVQVEINLYDLHGNQTGSTLANCNNLEPHGKWKFKAVTFEQGRYTFKVQKVTGY